MSTDKEKMEALLKEFGVTFETAPGEPVDGFSPKDSTKLLVEARRHEKVVGYLGFQCEFVFDSQGKFAHIGVWE